MSEFVNHERCPKCGPVQDRSGNNLGVYTDGHKWCFKCGYYELGTMDFDEFRKRVLQDKTKESANGTIVLLPRDCSTVLPKVAEEWLNSYGITKEERLKNRIMWSPMYSRLILPVFDDLGNCLLWQGRYFPSEDAHVDVKKPKYLTRGKSEGVDAYFGHIESSRRKVVVVEDYISSIKCSRVYPTLCLWGSELSLRRIRRMALSYKELAIWLDPDKASYSIVLQMKASPYFDKVSSIQAKKDPKCFTADEILYYIQ